jgi:hypothetical protein
MEVKLYYNLSFDFDYRVLHGRLRIKNDLRKQKHSTIQNDTLP